MKNRTFKIALVVSAIFAGILAGCSSPLAVSVGPAVVEAKVSPNESRLVFRAPATASRDALGDATYMTVQLTALEDGTTVLRSATKQADQSYVVVFPGLVADDWQVKARFFTSEAAPELKAYGNTTAYIAPGTSTAIALALYLPASISGVTLGLATKVSEIDVTSGTDYWGSSTVALNTAPADLLEGDTVQLFATTYGGSGNELATDQRVLWASDDESVASISSFGLLKARKDGITVITATSVEGRVIASFLVTVTVPPSAPGVGI